MTSGDVRYHLPWWKKWLSYIIDVCIEETTSVFGDDLYLLLHMGKLQLCTEGAIYSYEDRYYNFSKLFESFISLEKLSGNRTLLLGLGLGSVPLLLDKLYPGRWDMTAVEIDEEICRLSSTYLLPRIGTSVEVVIADALYYMELNDQEYHLICMDVFVEDGVPSQFKQTDFLENCARSLAPGGLLVFNTPAFNEEDSEQSLEFFRKFVGVFPAAKAIKVHHNFMLINNDDLLKA